MSLSSDPCQGLNSNGARRQVGFGLSAGSTKRCDLCSVGYPVPSRYLDSIFLNTYWVQDTGLRLIGPVAMESAMREGSFMGGRMEGCRPGWEGRWAQTRGGGEEGRDCRPPVVATTHLLSKPGMLSPAAEQVEACMWGCAWRSSNKM